jgi:hypothetical protein
MGYRREEGERHILRMKELYTPAVSQKQDPGISGLAEHHIPVSMECYSLVR